MLYYFTLANIRRFYSLREDVAVGKESETFSIFTRMEVSSDDQVLFQEISKMKHHFPIILSMIWSMTNSMLLRLKLDRRNRNSTME